MAAATAAPNVRRPVRRNRPAQGAQSLEWLALGGVITTALAGAGLYVQHHAGDLGQVFLQALSARTP